MKHISKILIIAFFAATNFLGAQTGMDKIKSLKIAFITERLNLSSDEAAVFWPVYNEHEDAIEKLRMTGTYRSESQVAEFSKYVRSGDPIPDGRVPGPGE